MLDNVTKLRKVQMDLLGEFSRVCRDKGLTWYVCFGTLLGAMRQDGFLPWDDDVDVVMPEKDFGILCTHKEWFNEDLFFLQTPNDPGFPHFAKLRKNGTTAFREGLVEELKKGGHLGICIDIIPLAEIPGSGCYHTPSLGWQKSKAVYLKDWFGEPKVGAFEELTVNLPSHPRSILNEAYGDWAWPAGVREANIGRSMQWFFDTETDYRVYVKRYTGMLEGIEGKKVYLFGAADSLRIWLERFDCRDQVVCTFDNDASKWGSKVYDVEVRNPKEIPGLMDEDDRIIITSVWHQEIGRELERMGIDEYFVYLDDYYDEKVGNKVVRREDMKDGEDRIPKWGKW